jgi:hypothetical protein
MFAGARVKLENPAPRSRRRWKLGDSRQPDDTSVLLAHISRGMQKHLVAAVASSALNTLNQHHISGAHGRDKEQRKHQHESQEVNKK